MNPKSLETDKLLNKLAKSASWWRRFFESTDIEEIHQIISKLSPLDLALLDQRVRGYSAYHYYVLRNWQKLQPSDIARLAHSKFSTSLVGLASFHPNGYVREAAVVELSAHNVGKELPFLLIRLNDWVAKIREQAAKAVQSRMEPAYAIHFLANITLVFRLRICSRLDKKFVDDICGLLKRLECRDVLQAGMASKDKTVRRISFQLAAESDPSSRAAIIRAIITDPDPVVRSWAVRHLLPDVLADELPGIVDPMLKDRSMVIRRDALWYTATKRPDIAKQPLRAALLEESKAMREMARQFLTVADITNARDFYADTLINGSEKQRFAEVCGLGETGNAADVSLVLPFLNSPLSKIRRAVAYAIGKLDLEGQLSLLVGILRDPKPSVSREAMKSLQPKARYIALADLENLFDRATDIHVRLNVLTLIQHVDKWKKVPALLKACADSDPRIAEQAKMALRNWFRNYNSSFAEPTSEDLQRISSALSLFESYLPGQYPAELRGCLKIYSI